jgi:hypothetical protein
MIMRFDMLPVEIFFAIFSYLTSGAILRAFYSINNYLNRVLVGYDHYSIDLTRIKKAEFDLIYSKLDSKQIISLIISENNFYLLILLPS